MELGEKLKAARLEAGLSQRQLCGDIITRNMLSQIENGSAKPSFATLQALCQRLGKPVRYFWEDAPSENLGVLYQAQQAEPALALEILQAYAAPDEMLDGWYCYLSARCYLQLSQKALEEGRKADAGQFLRQAEEFGSRTPEFTLAYGREMILLQYALSPKDGVLLAAKLPDNTKEQLLRAKAALEQGETTRGLAHLQAADRQTPEVMLLTADLLIREKAYEKAAEQLLTMPQIPQTYSRLELCYRELGNFERAYFYACKQR